MAAKESLACLVYSESKRKYYIVARQAHRSAAGLTGIDRCPGPAHCPANACSCRVGCRLMRPCSAKASVIRIDPQSGLLKFSHAAGRDIFESEVGAPCPTPPSQQRTGLPARLAHGCRTSAHDGIP